MSAPTFDKRVWGRPNPARWAACREVEAASAPEPAPAADHGHQDHACYHCPTPANCDCPCETCIRCRRMAAGTACCACGSTEGLPPRSEACAAAECATCRESREEDSHSDDGACCPGCDGYFACRCHDGDEREEESDHGTQYGDCLGCNPGCYGCRADYDPSDPWGDGAPEEHPGHPGYNGGYDSDY